MSGNKIGPELAKALADALKKNSSLQTLNLRGRWDKGNVWLYMKEPPRVMSEAGGEMKSRK